MEIAVQPVEIGVGGMTCAACVRRVEIGLRKIPTVVEASVNLATERASVRFDHNPQYGDIEAVRTVIAKLGYEPVDLSVVRNPHSPDEHDVETSQLWI